MDILDSGLLSKIFISLGIVLALVYSLSYFLKKNMTLKSSLKVIERYNLDHKRQFITIEQHHKRYILLLSPYGDILVDVVPVTEPPLSEPLS